MWTLNYITTHTLTTQHLVFVTRHQQQYFLCHECAQFQIETMIKTQAIWHCAEIHLLNSKYRSKLRDLSRSETLSLPGSDATAPNIGGSPRTPCPSRSNYALKMTTAWSSTPQGAIFRKQRNAIL